MAVSLGLKQRIRTLTCFESSLGFSFASYLRPGSQGCLTKTQRLGYCDKNGVTQPLPVLCLFTKDPCPLCDEAKEVLKPYMHRFELTQVDITLPENKHWFKKYKYDIPVFHFNGEFLMKHRVDLNALQTAIQSYEDNR